MNALLLSSVAFLFAAGFAIPTATEPETQKLTRLGEIQACWLTENALYEREVCTFLWCDVMEV